MYSFFSLFLALMATMVLVPPLVKLAHRFSALDRPGGRKTHQGEIPRIGGVAMVIGVLLSLSLWASMNQYVTALLMGIAVILVFGVWDDRVDLDYRLKFVGQLIAVCIVVFYGGIVISRMPFGSMDPWPLWAAVPFTILALIGVTNAINLTDGLDGLAGGLALLTLGGIVLMAYVAGGTGITLICAAIMGGILGFLRYNTHPATIFMGDTGSQFLGFSTGVLTVMLTQITNTALSPALPLLLLGMPILDTAMVIGQRLWEGRSPFSPDRKHIHHKLLELNFDHYEAVILIYLVQFLFVVLAVVLRYEADELIILLYLSACVGILMLLELAKKTGWKAHVPGSKSTIGRISLWIDQKTIQRNRPMEILKLGIPAFLLLEAFLISSVPTDFCIAAALVFVLLSLRLVFGYKLWFFFLRFLIFVTVAFIVYLSEMLPFIDTAACRWLEYAFFAVLAGSALLAIRYSERDRFKLTPTDFLLVFIVVIITALSPEQLKQYHVLSNTIKMIILFYGSELVIRSMSSRVNVFTLSVLGSLGVLVFRGLQV